MNLKVFLAQLTLYESNFRVLHWNSTGNGFDRAHLAAGDYYEMVADDIDVIAEYLGRLDIFPANIIEAVHIIEQAEETFTVIPTNKLYTKEEVFKYIDTLLGSIKHSIELLLDTDEIKDMSNVGIKAALEGLHDKYDKEHRYLNKRRNS